MKKIILFCIALLLINIFRLCAATPDTLELQLIPSVIKSKLDTSLPYTVLELKVGFKGKESAAISASNKIVFSNGNNDFPFPVVSKDSRTTKQGDVTYFTYKIFVTKENYQIEDGKAYLHLIAFIPSNSDVNMRKEKWVDVRQVVASNNDDKIKGASNAANVNPSASFVTYTDFLGFNGDRPNGIVQNEFNLSILTNNKPCPKNNAWTWGRNVVFGFNLTKLDQKLRYKTLNYFVDTTINTDDSLIRHIHTFDLVKYSNMNAYLKTNIISWYKPSKSIRFYGDLIFTWHSSGVNDSLRIANKDFNVNSIGAGLNLKFSTNFSTKESPWNLSLGFTSYRLSLLSNDVKQRYGPLYEDDNDPRNNKITKGLFLYADWLSIVQAEIKYRPNLESSSNVFLRFTGYGNAFSRPTNDGIERSRGNNFAQVQLGYVGNFDNIFIKQSKKDEKVDSAKKTEKLDAPSGKF